MTLRLATGGEIDRSRPLSFEWEGRRLRGFVGDTLASALMANGVRVVGRSFKYHRPRGLIGVGAEECNALVQVGEGPRSTANVRATEVILYDGLVARAVNCFPSSRFDIGAVVGVFGRFLPAGFYYKTFMWPRWALYEGAIRRAAGLGRVSSAPDPDRYESRHEHCDVLVIGAGPAGIAAARAAAQAGARVILAEQGARLGGSLLHDERTVEGQRGRDWAAATGAALAAYPEARILLRTTAVGYHDHNSITMIEQLGDERECAADPTLARYRTWQVRAARVVLATGAIERPLVFPGNDRPGVMLASAARAYARRFAVLPGQRPIVFTNNDDAYETAIGLSDLGADVAAVIDVRGSCAPHLLAALAERGIESRLEAVVAGTRGRMGVSHALVRSPAGEDWLPCNLIAMSGGYNPTVHLFSQSGGLLRFDEAIASFVPMKSAQHEVSVGAAAGVYGTGEAIRRGHQEGEAAAASAGFIGPVGVAPAGSDEPVGSPMKPIWMVAPGSGKAFVDFQNDVTVQDIELSARESFRSVEHLKRYTTLGMAPDQGKTSNVNALAIMGVLTGRTAAEIGHTRYRFPFVPIALGTMAGREVGPLFRPLRRLPLHDRHAAAGAALEDYGGWARPSHYLRPGESAAQAERREALAVRRSAGLFDGSPLGKIEVFGPDSARFLDLVYANTMSTLNVGRVRYGLMLNELGVIIDDGVVARLADCHYLVGTTSGGADRILAWLEEWLQCEWPDLRVVLAPVTSSWAVMTVSGPGARATLRAVGTTVPLDLAHMSVAQGRVAGVEARILRVSYTGETSYEINVPARAAGPIWDRLLAAGAPIGACPVGIEAWMVLRTEKGYLHVGADTDGTTTPLDVGWGHVLRKKSDFIGRRSLLRAADQRDDRPQFVGFAVPDAELPLPVGAHILSRDAHGRTIADGHVTSSAMSPVLGRGVALGMLRGGTRRKGEVVRLRANGSSRMATVTEPVFYDPEGERLND